MPQMEFGLFLEFETFPDSDVNAQMQRYLSLIELAETTGFASVWAGESYPKSFGAIQHVSSPLLILAHVAPRTSLALGAGVVLAPVSDALKLAYDVALLDQLCGGRLTLGVGLGNMGIWKRFGIDPVTIGQRMDETLLALKALWSGEDGFEGEIVRVAGGGMAPLPAQEGGPAIHVGGKIRRSARRAAEIGDGLTSGTHFSWPHSGATDRLLQGSARRAGKGSVRWIHFCQPTRRAGRRRRDCLARCPSVPGQVVPQLGQDQPSAGSHGTVQRRRRRPRHSQTCGRRHRPCWISRDSDIDPRELRPQPGFDNYKSGQPPPACPPHSSNARYGSSAIE